MAEALECVCDTGCARATLVCSRQQLVLTMFLYSMQVVFTGGSSLDIRMELLQVGAGEAGVGAVLESPEKACV